MAIIEQRASLLIKKFYENALNSHITLSRETVITILRRTRDEILLLDHGISDGCHVINPSHLSLWNEKKWTDVSSNITHWHYAFTHNKIQAIIHDAEHAQNMSDEAIRPV